MDLTVARLSQIVTMIGIRTKQADRQQRLYLTWQTRTLAQFIAATAMTDGNNPLPDAAEKVSLMTESEMKTLELQDRPDEEFDPEDPEHAAKVADRNRPGTYEALLGGFRPKR